MYVKPLFSVTPSDDQADSDDKSDKKQSARRSKQERSNTARDEKDGPASKDGYQTRQQSRMDSPPKRGGGGGEDMEALKQKKIEDIKSKLIREQSSQRIKPYKQGKRVEEEVKPSV